MIAASGKVGFDPHTSGEAGFLARLLVPAMAAPEISWLSIGQAEPFGDQVEDVTAVQVGVVGCAG